MLADWMPNRDVLVDWPGHRDKAVKPGQSQLKRDVCLCYAYSWPLWGLRPKLKTTEIDQKVELKPIRMGMILIQQYLPMRPSRDKITGKKHVQHSWFYNIKLFPKTYCDLLSQSYCNSIDGGETHGDDGH